LLMWLRGQGCPWDPRTCTGAARGGHLEVLKWARACDCQWGTSVSTFVCSAGARGGHLEILKWAHSNGCHWAWTTCAGAAEGGHLDVLKWARYNGCPWNAFTRARAAEGGHYDRSGGPRRTAAPDPPSLVAGPLWTLCGGRARMGAPGIPGCSKAAQRLEAVGRRRAAGRRRRRAGPLASIFWPRE
jgi:hypothetical protein